MIVKTVGISVVIGTVFEGARALASSKAAIGKLESAIGKLNTKEAKLRADTTELKLAEKQIGVLQDSLDKLQSRRVRMDAIVEGREQFRSQILDKVALGASVVAPVKVAIDFESSMADVKKVVDFANEIEFKQFSKELLSLTSTIPLSASELAQITASGGQLGIAKENLMGFTTTVAKMSTAFDMGAESAGDSIAKLMNVYSLTLDQVGSLGDAINHLSDNSAAKASQVVETLGRIGGVAKTFGLTSVQAGALSSSFIALGKSPEVAATSINALLLKLKTADKQGGKFQEALSAIGIDAKELKRAIDTDAQGALESFLMALEDVDKTEQMGVLSDLFGAEYADDIALLVGGMENYQKALKLTAKESEYAGSMEREFQNRSQTTANNLVLLKSSLEKIAITVGSVLLPAINSVITPLRSVFGFAADMAEKFPFVTKVVAGFAVGAIGLSIGLSTLGYMSSFVVGGFLRMANVLTLGATAIKMLTLSTFWQKSVMLAGAAASGVMTAAQWALNAAMSANPIGLVIMGIAALVGIGVVLYQQWEPIRAFFATLWESVGGYFDAAWQKISGGLQGLWGIIQGVFSFSPLGLVTDAWGGVFEWLGQKFEWVAKAADGIAGIGKSIAGFFGFGDDEEGEKKDRPSVARAVGAVAASATLAAASPVTMPKVGDAVVKPRVMPATVTPTVEQPKLTPSPVTMPKVGGGGDTIAITVNINNPKVTSPQEREALRLDVKKAVDEALRARSEGRQNRTFGDVS